MEDTKSKGSDYCAVNKIAEEEGVYRGVVLCNLGTVCQIGLLICNLHWHMIWQWFLHRIQELFKKIDKIKKQIILRMFKLTKWRWRITHDHLEGRQWSLKFYFFEQFSHHRLEIPCLVPVEKRFLLAIWWILASLVKMDQNWPWFFVFLWTLTLFWCTKLQKKTWPIITILTTCLQVNASCSTVKTRD